MPVRETPNKAQQLPSTFSDSIFRRHVALRSNPSTSRSVCCFIISCASCYTRPPRTRTETTPGQWKKGTMSFGCPSDERALRGSLPAMDDERTMDRRASSNCRKSAGRGLNTSAPRVPRCCWSGVVRANPMHGTSTTVDSPRSAFTLAVPLPSPCLYTCLYHQFSAAGPTHHARLSFHVDDL